MKFLTNTYDPNREDAKQMLSILDGESRDAAWQRYQRYLSDKIIGLPQATESYTQRELVRMNLVGVYSLNGGVS